jgi:hypothetical protein
MLPWPPRQSLWAGPNTHAGGGTTTPMTNTITILYQSDIHLTVLQVCKSIVVRMLVSSSPGNSLLQK